MSRWVGSGWATRTPAGVLDRPFEGKLIDVLSPGCPPGDSEVRQGCKPGGLHAFIRFSTRVTRV
ncbi:hypothetical protein CDES_14420 (plasmid) [Corynebacterium deserti GIMN1.010]|uniref:Uncharacterized protein n=1 Tax=Corynebacterium deserti GIMN1.010 TaxID=931089 RepID=A0A0M5IPU5_9CORY|nr:hypothetical protein CDES_14420 [Corynebacterium deserti GIMN1.010]